MDMQRNEFELVNDRKYFFRWFQFCSSINLGFFSVRSFVFWMAHSWTKLLFARIMITSHSRIAYGHQIRSIHLIACDLITETESCLNEAHIPASHSSHMWVLVIVEQIISFQVSGKNWSFIDCLFSVNMHIAHIKQSAQKICMTANISPFEFYRRLMNSEKREAPAVHRSH